MMEKFANDDKLEQLNAQRRRMKQQDHRRAVESLIEERRARRDFERQQVWLQVHGSVPSLSLPLSRILLSCSDPLCFANSSQEEAEDAANRRDEQLRRQIIEEERQRLLKQHATKLLGYLPKGVFQSEGEATQLGDEFALTYTRRPRDETDLSLY
jgi:hypothetical protein